MDTSDLIPPDVTFEEGMKKLGQIFGASPADLVRVLKEWSQGSTNQGQVIDLPAAMPLAEAIAFFKQSTRFKTYADSSRADCIDILLKFQRYIGPDTPIDAIKSTDIEDYMLRFNRRSERFYNKNLAFLRTLFRHLASEKKLLVSPALEVKTKNPPRVQPYYLTETQQQDLLDVSREGIYAMRNFTLVFFFLNTGAREEGAMNLRREWLNFQEGSLSLDEKGSKILPVPMLPDLADQFLQYFSYYPHIFTPNYTGPVFVNMKGGMNLGPMTEASIRSVLKIAYKKIGINDTKIHRLRRTFALNCLEHGMEPVEIMRLLRHNNLSTTMIYLGMDDLKLQKAMRKHFPLAVVSFRSFLESERKKDGDKQ